MGCAQESLKLLQKEVLSTISDLSDSAISALTVLKVQKESLSRSMDISLIPLQAKKAALEAVVGGLRESARIIPTNVIIQCPELGNVNTMIEQALLAPVEGSVNAVFEINRMVGLKAEVSSSITEIDTAIAFFNSLKADINSILTEA